MKNLLSTLFYSVLVVVLFISYFVAPVVYFFVAVVGVIFILSIPFQVIFATHLRFARIRANRFLRNTKESLTNYMTQSFREFNVQVQR